MNEPAEDIPEAKPDLALQSITLPDSTVKIWKPPLDVSAEPQNEPKPQQPVEVPYSAFPKWQRITFVYVASLAAFAGPVSAGIYFPAIISIAQDLDTSLTNINLTITTYMIFEAVAPTIVGGLSDRIGRRPAFLISFTLYTAANIGLALQNHWVALLVLRCLQSTGASVTTTLSSATVSDVAPRHQRGSYLALAAIGSPMGQALGPLIGGLLNHFLGWRSIFWFLTIFGGVMLLVYVLFMPETCRHVVGDGSLPPQDWNKPLIQYLRRGTMATAGSEVPVQENSNARRPGIFSTIPILLDKECFLVLFFGGLIYAGYYIIIVNLPQQLASAYHFNSIQVGLCYLPIGLGPLLARPLFGWSLDANFRRHARKLGIVMVDNRQYEIDDFPIEWARLEIGLVLAYTAAAALIPYGWLMGLKHAPLPAVVILLFIHGVLITSIFGPLGALLIDLNPNNPASATAANQFVRCLLGAGSVAVSNSILRHLGSGWTGMLVALMWLVMSSCWWVVILRGPRWRRAKKERVGH